MILWLSNQMITFFSLISGLFMSIIYCLLHMGMRLGQRSILNRRVGRRRSRIFTRGQFWPSGIVVACVCLCVCLSVCVSVNPELVRAINHHAFKLEPPNLAKRCKTTWLRSILFLGGDWPWPSRSNLTWKAKFTIFWACPCHNSPSIQARTTKFGQKMQTNLLVAHIVFGGDWLRPSWSNLTR